MGAQALRPNGPTLNAAVDACAYAGKWASVFSLLSQMRSASIPQDVNALCATVDVCERGGVCSRIAQVLPQLSRRAAAPLSQRESGGTPEEGGVDDRGFMSMALDLVLRYAGQGVH